MSMPPINAATTRIRKNIFLSEKSSQKLVMIPAIFPPIDVDKNQPPISKAVSLAGANLETSDNPIGLKKISLMVKIKYVSHNQIGEVLCV